MQSDVVSERGAHPRVINRGNGPLVYGSRVVSVFFDNGCVVLTLGEVENTPDVLHQNPSAEAVVAVSGRVVMTPATAVMAVQMINTVLAAVQPKQPGEKVQ